MTVRKVKRRGRVMWRARVYRNGKERIAYRSRKDDAVEAEQQLIREMDEQLREEVPQASRKEVPTLSGMWPDFVAFQVSSANKRPWRPRTEHEAQKIFRQYVEPKLGNKRIDQIQARDVDQLVAALEAGKITGRKLRPNTIANAMWILQRMLRVAKRWRWISDVPEIEARKRPADKIEDDKWLTADETMELLKAAEDPWRSILILAIRTGLRLGELRALRWGDVDLPGQRILVRRSWDDRTQVMGPPKGGTSREVPMTWDAVEALHRLERNDDDEALVFPGETGVPFSRSSFARAMEFAAAEAEISKHVHPHMTRHTYASHCVAQGIPSRVLMAWGGWKNEAMLARYAHLQPREVEHLVDRIAPKGRGVSAPDPKPDPRSKSAARRAPSGSNR